MKNVKIEVTGGRGKAKVTYTWVEKNWLCEDTRTAERHFSEVTPAELAKLKRQAREAQGDTDVFEAISGR